MFDVIIIGSGAAGIIASIVAAKNKKRVLLLEKLPHIAQKLKATGGGKCNLTNTLSNEDFMHSFGRNGRFMSDALNAFDHKDLIAFFEDINVACESFDGQRYFPKSRNSQSIIDALKKQMHEVGVDIRCNEEVRNIIQKSDLSYEIHSTSQSFYTKNVIIATGGLGFSSLGTTGDGYKFAKGFGHTITPLHPAMIPLHVKEAWVQNCRADTIAKASMYIDMKKYKKLKAKGDLIFTKNGIRGPIVLDFAREITPLLEKYNEVPLCVNLTQGKNEEEIFLHVKNKALQNPQNNILELCEELLAKSVLIEFCKICDIDIETRYKQLNPQKKEQFIKLLAKTPLHVIGHDGYKKAMITRGGVSLKQINPKTMQSKIQKGLYFCGEVVDLDGPCGGFNLQWSFSSGYLAGHLYR